MITCFARMKEISLKDKEMWFERNGRMLLEESITLFDGKINPLRQFSVTELNFAIEDFINEDSHYRLYRGFFQGRSLIVKKYASEFYNRSIVRDIVIASRMSVHKNVLKLIGCCLEMEFPSLVFESIAFDGTLYNRLRRDNEDEVQPLPWKDRLKIAVEISNFVAYLHTALPRPLILRDLKPSSMLLDKDGRVKLFDFSMCMPLPEGESYIEDVAMGTCGFIDPGYVITERFNEKVDVYSFGVTLLVLLRGQMPADYLADDETLVTLARKCVENELFDQILDPNLSEEESWPGKNMQIKIFLMIALQCIRDRADDRPDITDVARQLREMYRGLVSGS